jgi:hypothetical protein
VPEGDEGTYGSGSNAVCDARRVAAVLGELRQHDQGVGHERQVPADSTWAHS